MPIHDHTVAFSGYKEHRTHSTVYAAPAPPALSRLFEGQDSELSGPQPLDVFSPAAWPSCPACGERLLAVAVAMDTHDELVAAAMECYNREHTPQRYMYNVVTDTVYGTQARPVPATEPVDV